MANQLNRAMRSPSVAQIRLLHWATLRREWQGAQQEDLGEKTYLVLED